MSERDEERNDPKLRDLANVREDATGESLTTNQGLKIQNDQDSLKAGPRGPTLLEDFHLREKITHFDHERIPERVVHARGSGAHGFFQPYENAGRFSKAHFLSSPSIRTPVFVRFSTVAGSRGSSDLARDARGFAVKFYTEEGVYDLVGNNIPVFFIQDAIKFPDLIHAVKPEQDHEMPQAASAHDTFWDFISLMPEAMHMIMWVMSDRALPRSYRMMEGFGVHTFKLVDGEGVSRFVKFHWKPLQGLHSVAWDEAQMISGKDPDFHRRDLWEAIHTGEFPRWELGIQVVDEAREDELDFDLLDPTKLIPEELVPVQRIGLLTLDRNTDNFFAETEQVAFHPGHLVPGIDFSDDPLLQGRLFSYTDTQLLRLGGPNFHEIPINRPVSPVHNHQRDGLQRHTVNRGKGNYEPNTLGGGCPFQVGVKEGGFVTAPSADVGPKTRSRGPKTFDHFSQPTLFWNSQSAHERDHIVEALSFELGKVERSAIRERMVHLLTRVDAELAGRVAEGLGLPVAPSIVLPLNRRVPADGDPADFEPRALGGSIGKSPALSMVKTEKAGTGGVATRKVAILASNGVDGASLLDMKDALRAVHAVAKVVAPRLGTLVDDQGRPHEVDFSFLTASSVLFDAVYVPGGAASVDALVQRRDAIDFLSEAFRHCKPIAASGQGLDLIRATSTIPVTENRKGGEDPALIVDAGASGAELAPSFIAAIARHRNWARAGRMRKKTSARGDAAREKASGPA